MKLSVFAGVLIFLGCIVSVTWEIKQTLQKSRAVLANVEAVTKDLSEYTRIQTQALRDPKNQKAIDSGIQLAAAMKGTVELTNRVVIPRALLVLDRTSNTLENLSLTAGSLNRLVEDTNSNLNRNLLPEIAQTAKALGVTMKKAGLAIDEVSKNGEFTLDEINKLIASPEWLAILKNIESATAHVDGAISNVEDATRRLPSLADTLERMARTSSKFQKPILLLRAVSIALGIFF